MIRLKRQFRKWQKQHPNFITPYIIRLEQMNKFIIELSYGRGINNILYGISLREFKDGTFKNNEEIEKRINSSCVNTLQEAEIKISNIKRILKEVSK